MIESNLKIERVNELVSGSSFNLIFLFLVFCFNYLKYKKKESI
jgi:hypothetical protein